MTESLLEPRQRIVITGLGVVAPNGIGKQAFWNAVIEGRSGVDWITTFDTSETYCKIGGEITDFEPADFMEPKTARRNGRRTGRSSLILRPPICTGPSMRPLIPSTSNGHGRHWRRR